MKQPKYVVRSLAFLAGGFAVANLIHYASSFIFEEGPNVSVMESRTSVDVVAFDINEKDLDNVRIKVLFVEDGKEIFRYEGPVWDRGEYVLEPVENYLVDAELISLGNPLDTRTKYRSDFEKVRLAYHVAPFRNSSDENEINLDDNILDLDIDPSDLAVIVRRMNQQKISEESEYHLLAIR
tara:strand:+ start:1875 stop:2417 length:543 start_codon:yes stop_codon:yes gene_type:complete